MHKDINIQIIGTSQDVRLLKKIFKHYVETKATESEKEHINSYIDLIDYAVEKANERKCTLRNRL